MPCEFPMVHAPQFTCTTTFSYGQYHVRMNNAWVLISAETPGMILEEGRCVGVPKEDLTYTACYCEENIYMLCKLIAEKDPDSLDRYNVLFISNPNRTVPMWKQKASSDPTMPVVWDYHVFLVYQHTDTSKHVYDFDTALPFPCAAERYARTSFGPLYNYMDTTTLLASHFARRFRAIPASVFLQHFSSDRSHMRQEGVYAKPPPAYPPIANAEDTMNLYQYWDTVAALPIEKFGTVGDEMVLLAMLGIDGDI